MEFENLSMNNEQISTGEYKDKLDSMDSKLSDINTKFDVIIDILNKKLGNEKVEDKVEEKEIVETNDTILPTIEPINEEKMVEPEIPELSVVEENVNELPEIEVSNPVSMTEEVEEPTVLPTIEPVVQNIVKEPVIPEPVEAPEVKMEEPTNNVISIGDLLNSTSTAEVKEQMPNVENVEPVAAPVVPEPVITPEVKIEEPINNEVQMEAPVIPSEVVNDTTPNVEVPVEMSTNEPNVERLNISFTDAMGDGKQRSMVVSEELHNNLGKAKEKTLTFAA